MNDSGETLASLFSLLVILIGFGGIIFLLFVRTNFTLNDEGTHTGYVTAVEKEGMFVKHYRVYFKTEKQSSQEDQYCIPADQKELANKLRDTQKKDEKITIFYNEKYTTGIFNPACGMDEIRAFEFTNVK